MRIFTFPRLMKWMFATAITFLLLMFLLRLGFFFHFRSAKYTFINSLDAILLGLRFDLRVVAVIVLVPFLAGNMKLIYNKKNRLTGGSILRIMFTVLLMAALILFMSKGHAGVGVILFVVLLFSLFFLWLFSTKNCNPFENRSSALVFKTYFFITAIGVALLFWYRKLIP